MKDKMCDNCGEAPAVVHLQEIENDVVKHIDLCRRCAEERGYQSSGSSSTLQDLAEKLVTLAQDVSGEPEARGIRCGSCGLLYSDFSKTGRMGCPGCYDAFAAQLKTLLRKTHGATRHVGRRPGETEDLREERRELRRLRAELSRAIRHEEYESAAALRDKIKELQTSVRGPSSSEAP
jgi:protein arginine kinase activator